MTTRARIRRLTEGKLVVASHNPGKVAEITDLLADFDVDVVAAASLGLAEPEETGASFAENAALKACAAAEASGLPALADDSGLVVPALGGQPGIRSARWAGPGRDFAVAMRRVQRCLADTPDRSAHFICHLCLAWPDGDRVDVEGRVDGNLVWPPRGDRGFGYDPMFLPAGRSRTFGEMAPAEKHALSHRARAFAKLVAEVFEAHR